MLKFWNSNDKKDAAQYSYTRAPCHCTRGGDSLSQLCHCVKMRNRARVCVHTEEPWRWFWWNSLEQFPPSCSFEVIFSPLHDQTGTASKHRWLWSGGGKQGVRVRDLNKKNVHRDLHCTYNNNGNNHWMQQWCTVWIYCRWTCSSSPQNHPLPWQKPAGLLKIRLHHFSLPESTHGGLEGSCKSKMTKNVWISDYLLTGKCFHDTLHQTIKTSPRASSYQQVPPWV